MKYIISILITAVMLTGCFTESKMKKAVEKGNEKYPAKLSEMTRRLFPCNITLTDSTDYFNAINERDQLLGTIDLLVLEKWKQDSIINAMKSDSLQYYNIENCRKALISIYDISEKQSNANDSLKRVIEKLRNAKPVSIPKFYEDSAKIREAIGREQAALDTANYYKGKYAVDHEWRVAEEKKNSGKIVIRIPWLWLIIFLVIGGGLSYLKLKRIL